MPLNFSNSIIAGRLPTMRRWLVTKFDGAGFGFMLLHTHSYWHNFTRHWHHGFTTTILHPSSMTILSPNTTTTWWWRQYNFHLNGGLETLQNALQYDTTSNTNNGNFGGVLVGKHHVKRPLSKSWNLILDRVDYWRECQLLAGVAFKYIRSTMCFCEL
jgi:hypothetical protein